jgi:ATP synthase protein I
MLRATSGRDRLGSSAGMDRGFPLAGRHRESGTGPHGAGPSEEELAARLRSLDQRLDSKIEKRTQAAGNRKADNSGFATALSLSGTFVSAILVGAAIGWGIDRFFGMAPWGMIFFLFLGFAAGVLNVLRMSGQMSTVAFAKRDKDADRDSGADK